MSTETARKPPVPKGTGRGGRRLWRAIVDEWDLEEHELVLLREAVRTVDLLDGLAQVVADEGLMVLTPQGRKVNPALVEARQLRIALARILAALRMPSGDEGEQRPQRRVGARGVYTPAGATRLRAVQ